MAKELKVFIAGSLALESARDAVRSALLNISHKFDRYGYSIKSYTFENFDNSLCKDGRQNDYNHFIRNHADFVIFILDGILGEKTLEEFDHAFDAFKQNNRPQIFVYNNIEARTENEVILHFKKKMNDLGQYWTDYKNGELKNIVMLNFDNALFNLMKVEMPKYDAGLSPLSGSSTFAIEAKKLDILFKEYTIKTAAELNDALQASTKSTLLMVKTMADGDLEFVQQSRCNDALKNALRKSQAVLPQNLYETAYDIAVDYTQNGYNWVLNKIREDLSDGKSSYDHKELQSMHDTLIHNIVNVDEAQTRLNQFKDELMRYVNSL
jgi:hypothetical protein